MVDLVHDFIRSSGRLFPTATAVVDGGRQLAYAEFEAEVERAAAFFLSLGLDRGERVAIWLDKRVDALSAIFGTAAAGGVFVPINPLLKPEQVAHILKDCAVRILVLNSERLAVLNEVLPSCHDLRWIVLTNATSSSVSTIGFSSASWDDRHSVNALAGHRVIDRDMAAILYTSGSTGRPKGVVLSHRNLVAGANSVAQYLENTPEDRILSVLPLSFDYGLSQITTAFSVGARVVLMNYLLPRDVIRAVGREAITGLAAVPPLWIQLAQLDWPEGTDTHLRYLTNSGGAMPGATLASLRNKLPKTKPFLMYGLTEAFRSTFLPPEEVDRRPDSIGKAIPNAEILVVREDGGLCGPGEPGELVHRGVHVALGYWNDPEKTAERYKPAPAQLPGLVIPELAVWSGDTVKTDSEGFLYFIGRRDEMIKTSGYRVSPTEIEEVVYAFKLVLEVAAIGVAHPVLGQAIVLMIVVQKPDEFSTDSLMTECKRKLPSFMVPAQIVVSREPLPRNPNGKIDRKLLATEKATMYMGGS